MADTIDPLKSLQAAAKQAVRDLATGEHRTECIRFYVTAAEARRLTELCQGVNRSRFIRSKVFGYAVPRPRAVLPQVNQQAYTHLANIRGNINQIAKAVNTAAKQGQRLPLTEGYLTQLSRLERLLVTIGTQLSQAENTDRQEEGGET